MLADVRSLVTFNHAYFDKLPVTSVEQHLGKMLAVLAFSELVVIALFDDPTLVYHDTVSKASAFTNESDATITHVDPKRRG